MNSPTPETDAFENKLISRGFPVCAFDHKDCEDSLDFARKLERERNAAYNELIRAKALQRTTERVWHDAEAELTKTRNELDKLNDICEERALHILEQQIKHNIERDQLRNKLTGHWHKADCHKPDGTCDCLPHTHSYREDSTVCEICGE